MARMRGTFERRTWRGDATAYAPARHRRPCRYDAFVPAPLGSGDLRVGAHVLGVVSDAEDAIRRLNSRAQPALAPLARLLLRTESIASSKVEGLQVDARTLARAEARADAGGRVGPTVAEVLAGIDAMQLAIEEATSATRPTRVHLCAIHRRLMQGSATPHLAGAVRDDQNWIGGNDYTPCGADFVPPPPEFVAGLLDDLCSAMIDDTLPPLVHAALVHAQFETIHPFADGNGRTGRALVQVILRRRGLAPAYVPPISVVLAGQRDRYIEGLTWFRQDRVEEWIERFAAAAATGARLAAAYLASTQDLQGRWRDELRAAGAPRVDAAAWVVLDHLPAHPVVTVPVLVAATGRSKPAVAQAVDQLAGAGVLRPLTAGARNRSWEASGLLDLLAGLEEGRAP